MCSSLSLPTKRGNRKDRIRNFKPSATVDEIREVRLLEAGVPRRKLAEWRVRVYQPCCRIASFGIYLRTANISVASCRLY